MEVLKRAFLVFMSRLGLVRQTTQRLWGSRSGGAPFAPSVPGRVLCLFPNPHPSRAAAVHGGSPGGHLVQHGPDEGARLRPQSGFPDEHAGRGKGRARNRGQAGAVLAAKGSVRRGLGNSVWTLVAVRSWTPAGSWEKEIQATGSSL